MENYEIDEIAIRRLREEVKKDLLPDPSTAPYRGI